MGVGCVTYCETCNVEAAEIGDGGCVTTQPSLDPKWVDCYGDLFPTFGFVYQCLAAIHLVPFELAAYKEFLEEHKGHDVVFVTDHDDYEPKIDFDTLKIIAIDYKADQCFSGCYMMRNIDTMECIKTSADYFFKFESTILTKTAVDFFHENFIQRWEVMDAFYGCPPSITPCEELGDIIAFMKRNRTGTLEVYLEPESP